MAFTSPRKLAKGRRHLPEVPVDSPRVKVVTFSSDVVETSIGGTQTVAKTKGEPLVSVAPVDNVDSRGTAGQGSFTSTKTVTLESKARSATQGSKTNGTDNKENLHSEDQKDQQQNCESVPSHDTFASPVAPPLRPASRENGIKQAKRTTQDHLDDMARVSTPPLQYRRHTLESEMFETPDCYRVVQLETPRRGNFSAVTGYLADESVIEGEDDGEDSCSITVAVRVRPYSQRELADPNVKRVVSMSGNETIVTSENGNVSRFAYDFSFWSFDQTNGDFAGQDKVYTCLAQPLLGKAFEGYNTCLFAYGQTGSGKSYSIMGHGQEVGIIPRFCEELFYRADQASDTDKVKISVEISFFEIYNEKIHDLLASSKEKRNGKKPTLKVREHPVLGPYVEGLSTFVVNSFEDVEGWITLGNKNRATAATGMNDKSSRSHSVFTIVLTQTRTERLEGHEHDHSITSKINLVDLAGSERQSQAQTSGARLREGANINRSLLTLGKVISLLSERSSCKKRKLFIPYRESVLTWLLKESLGGNSKTAMMATISPSNHHTEETLSTLRYAHQTRSIVNVVRVNEDPKGKLIRELRAEIEKLRSQSGTLSEESHMASLAEITMLREKLMSKEREMDELSRSWQERLRQAEARKQEESKLLEKSGVAVMVDNQLPNLVNLNEDPQLSELLLYVIKTGQTRVGRKQNSATHDIQLSGALIADNHCIINNMEGIVNITPIGDAPTYVNGNLITEPTTLHHGDRVILGGDHYFRFNHPIEVKRNKKGSGGHSSEVKDFEFARQELLSVQEARLQAELLAAERAAQAKMEEELERAKREAEMELNQQKTGYEGRLADLEKTLKEQTLQVQKAEQSQQEAHSLIEDLRKQKMMLEQEVLAARKRQQLEAEAAKKVNTEFSSNKSRILELLLSERSKAKQRLDEVRQKRAEMVSPSRKRRHADGAVVGQRRDLYKVALLLREANKISQYLKKNLVFSREDVEDDSEDGGEGGSTHTMIKVTNTHHHIYTYWTVAKLEEKVMQMRDLYQNDGDSSADDDEVFNDPDDTWEKENPSPVLMTDFARSPVSTAGTHSSQNTPKPPLPRKRVSFGASPVVGDRDVSMFKACRKLVTSAMDCLNSINSEETVADKILVDCDQLRSSVIQIVEERQKSGSRTAEVQSSSCSAVIQLVSSVQLLASHCSTWAGSFDLDTPVVRNLLNTLTDQVRGLGVEVSHLLQGIETDLASLVQEAGANLTSQVLSVCHTCGELALATKTCMRSLEEVSDFTAGLSVEVYQAFLSGCTSLFDNTLEEGLRSVESCETQAQALSQSSAGPKDLKEMSKGVERTVANIKGLLQACQDVQVEVDLSLHDPDVSMTTNSREGSASHTSQHYHQSYQRMQGLTGQVSSLAEMPLLLLQIASPVIKGESQDFKRIGRCAELIHKRIAKYFSFSHGDNSASSSLLDSPFSPTSTSSAIPDAPSQSSSLGLPSSRLLSSSIVSDAPRNQSSSLHFPSSASRSDSVFLLSEAKAEHLDCAVQEVLASSRSLMEQAQKMVSPECAGATPTRGKRFLPLSPENACASPRVTLQKAGLSRNILLGRPKSSTEDSLF